MEMTDEQIITWIAGTIIHEYELTHGCKLNEDEQRAIVDEVILILAEVPEQTEP